MGAAQIRDELGRWRRIVARALNNKSVPDKVFRLDERTPEVIAADGFAPWNSQGSISLKEHVRGALDERDPEYGTAAKWKSQWVSTGALTMLQDPTLITAARGKYLYQIDTHRAGGGFMDVNDHFDRSGIHRPYAKQREWAREGGVPAAAVTGYLKFEPEALEQLEINPADKVDPVKLPAGGLTGWHDMPY